MDEEEIELLNLNSPPKFQTAACVGAHLAYVSERKCQATAITKPPEVNSRQAQINAIFKSSFKSKHFGSFTGPGAGKLEDTMKPLKYETIIDLAALNEPIQSYTSCNSETGNKRARFDVWKLFDQNNVYNQTNKALIEPLRVTRDQGQIGFPRNSFGNENKILDNISCPHSEKLNKQLDKSKRLYKRQDKCNVPAEENIMCNKVYVPVKGSLLHDDVPADQAYKHDTFDIKEKEKTRYDNCNIPVKHRYMHDTYSVQVTGTTANDKVQVLDDKLKSLTVKPNNQKQNVTYNNSRKSPTRSVFFEPKGYSFNTTTSILNIEQYPSHNANQVNPALAVESDLRAVSGSSIGGETNTNTNNAIGEREDPKSTSTSGSSDSLETSETSVSETTQSSAIDNTESSGSLESSGSSRDNDSKDNSIDDDKKDISVDDDKKENSSSSSSTSSQERKKKKIKKRKGFFTKLLKSAPEEKMLIKMVLWFPVGIGISTVLYFLIIQKINLEDKYKAIIGSATGLLLSLTFSLSVQMRCVMTLVIPSFVGKAGRSYFAAFAMVYLINGPITNIMDNCKEIVRSMTCNTALTANHTKIKWMLRIHPVENALGDLMKDNHVVQKASKKIKKAFKPLSQEVEANKLENNVLKKNIKKEEKNPYGKNVVDTLEEKYKAQEEEKQVAGKTVEKEWVKKLDLRCRNVFSDGVGRCKTKMGQLENKCMSKLWLLGYVLCWPLKITVFCKLVTLIPGAIGMECDSSNNVSPGFGDTYLSARGVVDDMEAGAQVNLQYKIVGSADADYMPVEELRQATIMEVKAKTDTINMSLAIITHFLTFTFLIIFYGAYKYNSKYLTELSWDNKYVTSYFRHIDARRKAQDKRTLLPLKKFEKKEFYDPNNIKLSVAEKKSIIKGTIKLLMRVVLAAVICYMDSMFFQVLDIIARNSKIEYHQTGEHIVDIKIYGKGFMSQLVRSFLERFNSKQVLDSLTTNYECLPKPSKTDIVILSFIFGTYILVWVFMYFETFGLRMRRVIASFYYRKREKKRILYLYNEMYRKRLGFLQHMRAKVRKALKERELKRKVGLIMALKRRFPSLSRCLNIFQSSKDTCLICGDPEKKDFHKCPTEGCGVGYCKECWIDIKKKCYACGQFSETEDDDASDSETADDGDSSASGDDM